MRAICMLMYMSGNDGKQYECNRNGEELCYGTRWTKMVSKVLSIQYSIETLTVNATV